MTGLRLQTIFIQSQQSHKFRSHIHISSKNRLTDLLPLLTKSRVLSKIWLFTLPSHLYFDSPYRAPTSIGLFYSITDTRSEWRPCSNQHHWYNSPSQLFYLRFKTNCSTYCCGIKRRRNTYSTALQVGSWFLHYQSSTCVQSASGTKKLLNYFS